MFLWSFAKIYEISDNRIGVHLDVDEGKKFYIRDVKWVGNSVYETEFLQKLFGVKKGDAYDQPWQGAAAQPVPTLYFKTTPRNHSF